MSKLLILCAFMALGSGVSAMYGQTHAHHQQNDTTPVFSGTLRMIELLERANAANYIWQNPFASASRLVGLRKLAQASPENNFMLAQELINAGSQDEAIPLIQTLRAQYSTSPAMMLNCDRLLAVAYLRQGEVQNCVANHTSQSCLFPIGPGGRHTLQGGSRAAIGVLRSILERVPDDLQSRWLLNVAAMTVGIYPDSVPGQWLLPPSLFASEYPLPTFTDVAPSLGIDGREMAGGCCTEDFDGDGDLDILVSSWGMKSPMTYYRNDGGTFADATAQAGLTGLTGGLNMIHADYDNDGDADVLVLRGAWMREYGRYPNSLLRNNGGVFEDVTIEAGILSFHPTQTAVFADLNKDGWLDIFIGNESGLQPHPCELFVNNRNGTFTERSKETGLAVTAYVKGITCADYNNDGWEDLYLSCHGQSNCLLKNNGVDKRGRWTFSDVTRRTAVGSPTSSFPTFFFDYDNDGWEDLFVCGYGVRSFVSSSTNVVAITVQDYLGEPNEGEMPRLYHNDQGTFSDRTVAAGLNHPMLGMGANFGDLDNDGFLDMYIGTGLPDMKALVPNRMFRNAGDGRFQDVTTAGGFGHLQKGHAIAFADMDNDGDQDVYAVMGGAYEGDVANRVLYLNPGNDNHWVTLTLEGVKSNRSAIGARIAMEIETPSGKRMIHRTVNTGGSFGAASLRQEIGLGDATRINAITVTWPASKQKSVFHDVAMNGFYHIREGGALRTQNPARLNLQGSGGGHRHH